jgi:hypothetical protein
MNPLKLRIFKKFELAYGWKRNIEMGRLEINEFSSIKTEGQLMAWVSSRWGFGRFLILCNQRGHKNFWKFWLGWCSENGYVRDVNKNKDLERAKFALARAKEEDKETFQEEVDLERELSEVKEHRRVGPYGLIRYRPGALYRYEDF